MRDASAMATEPADMFAGLTREKCAAQYRSKHRHAAVIMRAAYRKLSAPLITAHKTR